MDLTPTIVAKSDQINAGDLQAPLTARIVRVSAGEKDQPVQIHLDGQEHVWRPCKTMRRVLVAMWGADGRQYVGRSLTLYCDPEVMWAGQKVGGIRISHASHIDGPVTLTLQTTRGKYATYRVEPLRVEQPPTTPPPATWPTDEDRIAFTDALDGCTMAEVEAVCAAQKWPHPAAMTPEKRAGLLTWLSSDAGRSAVEKVRS